MDLKIHYKLQIPEDSAWGRKTIKRHLPMWLNEIITGISNILVWISTIYKDRNYDSHYIFEIIKFKLIKQRNYLVAANRHMGVEALNKDITLCLNLIERIQSEYYGLEYMDYCKDDFIWTPSEERKGCSELNIIPISENFDEYFKKYKSAIKKVLNNDRNLINSKKRMAIALANHNQKRCQDLLFKVLNEKIGGWWD